MKVTSANGVNAAIAEITRLRAARRRTHAGQPPDFQVTNQADQLKSAQDQQKTYRVFLLVITSISLLVRGIGKAITANGSDILTQFVTGAVLICLIGALTGVVGLLAAYLVGRFYQHTIVSVESIVIAVAFATMTGLFFGAYPAKHGAALRPIEVLHYVYVAGVMAGARRS